MHRVSTIWCGGEAQAVWCRKGAKLETQLKREAAGQAREGSESLGKETDLCSAGVWEPLEGVE